MICSALGYTRQNYYKQYKDSELKRLYEERIISLVLRERKLLPRLGTRKIYHRIKASLLAHGLKIGRDKLFALMQRYDFLLKPRRRYVQTTFSRHWMRKYPNLVKHQQITRPEQVWVSDITYIKTEEGNSYLTMITDAYTRRIMGYKMSKTMEASASREALQMAINNRSYKGTLIHHSDRGLQYCSKEYVELAESHGISMSMTEQSDPYENALAERMNRTIKEEFGLNEIIKDHKQARLIMEQAVLLYNTQRPHLALDYNTPEQVHKEKIPAAI